MLAKAATLAADQVFLDLEDAVSPLEKVDARDRVVDALRTHDYSGKTRVVRVNGVTTRWCLGDVTAVSAVPVTGWTASWCPRSRTPASCTSSITC